MPMDQVQVDPEATARRARELLDVADEVSRVALPEAAQAVAAAMPGSASSRGATELAEAWADELRSLAVDTTRLAEGIEASLRDLATADSGAADALARLRR